MTSPVPAEPGTAICARPKCGKPVYKADHCRSDYAYWRLAGNGGFTDPGPARARVIELLAMDWTCQQIAETSGVAKWTLSRLRKGIGAGITPATSAAILSVLPGRPVPSSHCIDATGTRRRVQALAWMGWSRAEVARRAGVNPRTLRAQMSLGRVSTRLAERIRVIYAELSWTRGPSAPAAAKARSLGLAPPAAWDDIDDPLARPSGVLRREVVPAGGRPRSAGLRPCGSDAAIKRHKRAGEKLCPACRVWHAAQEQRRTSARRDAAAAEIEAAA